MGERDSVNKCLCNLFLKEFFHPFSPHLFTCCGRRERGGELPFGESRFQKFGIMMVARSVWKPYMKNVG